MTEDFATDALAYLLDELDGPGRARFEAALARDPAASAEFKGLADALADYAVAASPERELSAQVRGETIVAVMNEVQRGATRPRRGWASAYFWPAAAALLLLLNLGQWWRHSRAPAAPASAAPPVAALPGVDRTQAHFAALTRADSGRRAAPESPAVSATVSPSGAAAFGVTLTFATVISETIKPGPAIATVSFSQAPPAASSPVYGWSAFDPQRHQGAIDLHNLPNVADGQCLQLWVRMVGSSRFIRVGEIPSQIYGRSGSIAFCLPSLTDTPAQIRITVEPRRSAPPQPTGVEVLRVP